MNLLKIKYHNKENKVYSENSLKCRLRRKFKGYKKNII